MKKHTGKKIQKLNPKLDIPEEVEPIKKNKLGYELDVKTKNKKGMGRCDETMSYRRSSEDNENQKRIG